ncbi:MAG: O-antigen ligase family protein [Candidatus Peribacteraceae bacterium]|jgi:O-antigen ligase
MGKYIQKWCDILLLVLVTCGILFGAGAAAAFPWLIAGGGGACILVSLLAKPDHDIAERSTVALRYGVLALAILVGFSLYGSAIRIAGLHDAVLAIGLALLFFWTAEGRRHRTEVLQWEKKFLSVLAHVAVVFFFTQTVFLVAARAPMVPGGFPATSVLLLLLWPSVLWMRNHAATRKKWEWDALLGCIFGLLLFTGTLLAFAALTLQFLLLFTLFKQPKRNTRALLRRWGVIAGIAVAVAPAFFLYLWAWGAAAPWGGTGIFAHAVATQYEWWKAAARLIVERPLLGWGPGTFGYVYPRIQEHIVPPSAHPHSLVLRIGVEYGLLPLLCLMLLGAVIAAIAWRSTVKGRKEAVATAALALAGAFPLLLLDEDPSGVAALLLAVLFLGILARPPFRALPAMRMHPLTGGFFLFLLASLLLLVSVRETRFLLLRSFAAGAMAKGNERQALYWYQRAASSWEPMETRLSLATIAFHAQDLTTAEAHLRSFVEANPFDANGWRLLGDLLLPLDPPAALAAYERALELHGGNNLLADRGFLRALATVLRSPQGELRAYWATQAPRITTAVSEHLRQWEDIRAPEFTAAQLERSKRNSAALREDLRALVASFKGAPPQEGDTDHAAAPVPVRLWEGRQ